MEEVTEMKEMMAATKDKTVKYIGPGRPSGKWFKNQKTGKLYLVGKDQDGKYEVKETKETRTNAENNPKRAAKVDTKPVNNETKQAKTDTKPAKEGSRAAIMTQVQAKGIAYFRVMNKEELTEALTCGADRLKEIQETAKKRWQSGWGKN
jgi:hypothetical protein